RLVFGRVKVCGLTRQEDLAAARAEGASYGGLIFLAGSPRKLTDVQARNLAEGARDIGLPIVGVFRDAPVEMVIDAVRAYGLAAVQLHGREDPAYAMQVKLSVPGECEIWTTVPVAEEEPD